MGLGAVQFSVTRKYGKTKFLYCSDIYGHNVPMCEALEFTTKKLFAIPYNGIAKFPSSTARYVSVLNDASFN